MIFPIIGLKNYMNTILLILIFIISIINVKSNSNIQSLYYKPIFLTNGKYLIIKNNGIYTYNKNLMKIEKKYIFQNEFSSVLSKQDIDKIFIFEKILPRNFTFIFIKNYLYISSEKGEIILKNKFLKAHSENYKILLLNNINNYYYYCLLYKKSNSIVEIDIFEYNYSSILNNLLFSHIIDISKSFKEKFLNLEDNFNCEFMSRINFKNKLLTCFVENDHEIISNVYKIDIKNRQIFLLYQKTGDIKLNNKTGKIKIFISVNNEKSLICNYENFSYYNCIIYDINKNIFSEYNNYLNNCQNSIFHLKIEYMKELKKYIFYCFNSRHELNFVELNEDLEIVKNDKNKTNNIQKYIKTYKNNIFYNNRLPFLLKKNLVYNIEIKNSYINNNRQLQDNNNGESKQENINPGEENNNQDNSQILNEGKDGQNQNEFNEGKDGQNQNEFNEGKDGQNQNELNEGKDGQNQNELNEGKDGSNQNELNEGKDGSNQNEFNEGNQGEEGGKQGKIGDGDKNFDFDFEKGKTNMTKGEIRENRRNIMENYEPGKSYTMQGDGFDIKVAPMGKKEEGKTYIDFQLCEEKLREKYGLNESAVLSVFQTQTASTNEKSITNKVQYVVYDEDNNQLDLSICNDEKIKINYALRNDTALDTTKLKNFGDKGIDILNSSDPFFNDICYSYSSEGGSDMVLKDRISDVYQNFSICDSGCEYESIDTDQMTVACSCSVSNDTDSDDDDDSSLNLKDILLSLFQDSTFGVIKCYNLVFDISNKKNNIGFWLFSIIIICHIPLYILFFLKGISPIKEFIINEMKKYNYFIDLGTPPKKKMKKISLKKFPNQNMKTINNELTEGTDKRINVMTPKSIKNFKKSIALQIQHNNLIEHTDYSKRTETNDILSKNSNQSLNKKKEKNNINKQYFLIQLDANNTNKNIKPLESNYHLDNYEYEDAIEYENRTFWRILYIVMLSKDNILNTFLLKFPLESQPLRICLLLFSYTSDLALNTLFYFSDNISDKYHYTGDNLFWFTLFNNIIISIISTILSIILGSILESMIDSKDSIEDEFKEEEKKMREDPNYQVTNERKEEILLSVNKSLKKLKVKMIVFVVIDFIILLFFYYFTTAFCSVYQNTQSSWITDAVVSIIISFPIEIAIALVITVVYMIAIKYRCKFLYKISMFFA